MSSERLADTAVPPQHARELADGLLDVYLEIDKRDFQLEPQQELAIEAIADGLANGMSEGHVNMATSTGKSVAIAMLAEAAARTGKRAIIFAPSVAIADELVGLSGETGLGRFSPLVSSGQVARHYGGHRADATAPVVVTTYSGLLHEYKTSHPQLGEFDALLSDECHRSLGPETSKAAREYMPNAVRVGYSATPDYAVNRRSEEVYGEAFFEFSLRDAIESGATAPVRALLFETGQTLQLSEMRDEFTDKELEPLIHLMPRNTDAMQLAKDLVSNGRQGFMACVPGGGNAHARLLANMLSVTKTDSGRNIIALDVGSHLSHEEQANRVAAYHRGEVDILTFTKSLQEGWHGGNTSFGINLAPTASPLKLKQLLGRTMAKRLGDDRESIFIDFVDQTSGIAKQQYTALHALDIDDIDVTRVLGRAQPDPNYTPPLPASIEVLFDPELYAKFLQNQGKLLRDVMVGRQQNTVDPLARHWERVLTKQEGLSAELAPEGPAPASQAIYQATSQQLFEALGREPSHKEIMTELVGLHTRLSRTELALLGDFAIRLELDEALDILADQPIDAAEELSESEDDMLKRLIKDLLLDLPERMREMLELRFGLDDSGEPHNFVQVGQHFNLTGTRATQEVTKGLAKLRNTKRSNVLRSFIGYDESEEPRPKLQRIPPRQTPGFGAGFPELTRGVDEDSAAYLARLSKNYGVMLHDLTNGIPAYVRSLTGYETIEKLRQQWEPIAIAIHDKRFIKTDDIAAHYQTVIERLDTIMSTHGETLKNSLSQVKTALEYGWLSPNDIFFAYNVQPGGVIRSQDVVRRYHNRRLSAFFRSVAQNLDHYRELAAGPTDFSSLLERDPGIRRIDDEDALELASINSAIKQADRYFEKASRSFASAQNRPHNPATADQRQATMIVAEAQFKYYKELTTALHVERIKIARRAAWQR